MIDVKLPSIEQCLFFRFVHAFVRGAVSDDYLPSLVSIHISHDVPHMTMEEIGRHGHESYEPWENHGKMVIL